MKLRTKLITFSLIPAVVTLSVIILVTTIRTFEKINADAVAQLESLSEGYAAKIDAELEVAMDAARTLAQIFENFGSIELNDRRKIFNAMLRAMAVKNPFFLGTWTCWEPNALDGLDSQYVNTVGHDNTGRFIPYWNRFEGNVVKLSALEDYDKEGAGDYYQLPLKSGKEHILEPYQYTVSGKTLLLTTLSVPIKDPMGRTIGVAGIDISIDELQKRYSKKIYGKEGYVRLLSGKGIIIAHADPNWYNKPWEESSLGIEKEIFERLKKGETFTKEFYSDVHGKKLIKSFSPIFVGNAEVPWIVSVVIPQKEVFEASFQLEVFIAVVSLIGLAFIGIILFYLSRSITRPVVSMANILKEISEGEGDLTRSIQITSKDEIGEMASYFNLTFEKIRNLVTLVKQQTDRLRDVGTELSTNMIETASAINEITANIKSIKNQIMNQSASVSETSATMEQVTKGIEKLSKLIEEQAANVTESSSAIEEMMANIHSVSQTLIKNSENIQKLSGASEAGRRVVDTITAAIQNVARESEGLMEISQIIQNVAEQTNLLSMNAAIEAAHAGEAGKGFAVVADEIRKLAESSSSQAKTIQSVLKNIKDSISSVIQQSHDVVAKFAIIEKEVKVVSEQEEGIRKAMEEQAEGSKQVLEAITVLTDITQKVRDGSVEMLTGSKQVLDEAKSMNSITQEITNGMNEMANGAEQVAQAIQTVNELSVKNKESIDSLTLEVNKFKV